MSSSAKRAARGAEATPVVRVLARSGFVASGAVHAGIGVLILVVAFGGREETDQTGALKAIAAAPAGFVVLWMMAIALWALAVWFVFEGVLARGDDGAKKTARRLGSWAKAVAYLVIGVVAAIVATGAKPDSDKSARQTSGTVLQLPGGPILLGATGLVIGGIGVGFAVIGITRRFGKLVRLPAGAAGTIGRTLGVVGYVAKGFALAVLGGLLVVAAVRIDPKQAGGLDEALASLTHLPAGRWLLGAVGIGFLAYAAFLLVRARWARL